MISRIFLFVFLLAVSIYQGAALSGNNQKALLSGRAEQILEEVQRQEDLESRYLTEDFSLCNDVYLLGWYVYFCGEKDFRMRERLQVFYLEKKSQMEDVLRKEFGTTQADSLSVPEQKRFAEIVNFQLHQLFFKKYRPDADAFSNVMNGGFFNCVSSSVLYVLLLSSFGMKPVPVQAPEHVFSTVIFPDGTKVDVETTNAYGFDPGKKKNVLDELGKITGFSYVKQKDYQQRIIIPLKSLLLLPVYNRSAWYTRTGNHEEALRLAWFLKRCRQDEKGESEFSICFYNLLADLSAKREPETELQLLYYYLEHINADDNRIRKMRFQALAQMLADSSTAEDFQQVRVMLQKEEEWCRPDEKTDLDTIIKAFPISLIQFYYKNLQIEEAYSCIQKVADKNLREGLLRNTFAIINQKAMENETYEDAVRQLRLSRTFFPESQDFRKAMQIFWNNYLANLTGKGNFSTALQLLTQEKGELGERGKRQLLQMIYNSYAYSEYKKNNFLAAAEICAKGCRELGNEKVLIDNMKIYYLNALRQAERTGNRELEVKIKENAASYFPSLSEFR